MPEWPECWFCGDAQVDHDHGDDSKTWCTAYPCNCNAYMPKPVIRRQGPDPRPKVKR